MFRVVQEALTNVHRHSGSATAKVHLARDCGRFILEVRDSGKGMLPEVLERVRRGMATVGVGIAGMRERVAQVDGELFVESTGQGTVITAIFPLDITEAGCS